VTIPQDQSERERAIRAMRAKRYTRARVLKSKERRQAAIQSGEAKFVTVNEFAELTGVHQATVWRRIKDGTLKVKRLVGKNNKIGRTLIPLDQLG
jgi:excisionase family DNA binding protein